MANIIKHKKSSVSGVVPAASGLEQAELAINIADGKLYTKNYVNSIINLGVTSISGTTITPASGLFSSALKVNGVDVSVSGHTHSYVTESSTIVTTVFNKTASTIPKLSVVYINGGQGDQPTVQLAIAGNEAGSSKTYGITAEAITTMNTGKVVVNGALSGINTDQFNPTAPIGDVNGTALWLSPTTSGGITTSKPYAPNHSVFIGTIIRTHQNEGIVEVKIQNGYELEELHNVATTGAINGQFLQYNSSSGLWFPSSSGNFTTLTVNNTGVSLSGHSHSSSDITNFNSSVSGLLTPYQLLLTNPVTGTGTASYIPKWTTASGLANSLIYDNGTNIGIGTISPSAKLHVIGSGIFSSGIKIGDSSTNGYIYGPSGNSSIQFNNAAQNRTDINGASVFLNGTFNYFNGTNYCNGTLYFPKTSTPTSTASQSNANEIRLYNGLWNGTGANDGYTKLHSVASTAVNGATRFGIFMNNGDGTLNNTERLSILSNGNVGVGLNSPADKLEVSGNIRITDGAGRLQLFRGGGTAYDYSIGKEGNHTAISTSPDSSTFRYIQFGSHASNGTWNPQTVINGSNGNVGIGTTSPNLAARLTIAGSGNTSASAGLSIINSSSTNLLYVRDDGNIGIGTTTPSTKLHVIGTSILGNISISGNAISVTNTSGILVLAPNGNGALQTTIDGNTRGIYSVDLQRKRNVNTQVSSGPYCSIGGGSNNTANGSASSVGGGNGNVASAEYATVGGGDSNSAIGDRSTVAGGGGNSSSGYISTIGGGGNNSASNNYSTVGGGYGNSCSGYIAVIGGGRQNNTSGSESTIGGGYGNAISSIYATVGGGRNNTVGVYGQGATIAGGRNNTVGVYGQGATIAGGRNNTASNYYAVVCGGINNTSSNYGAVVVGGHGNTSSGYFSIIVAGKDNTASNSYTTIGGGVANDATGNTSTVGGGQNNSATNGYSTVGGGLSNTASGYASIVGGGTSNTASGYYGYATVGGGQSNTAGANHTTIGGGLSNSASGYNSTVGGGHSNIANDYASTVGGGYSNSAVSYASVVGGGFGNSASGYAATIGGGKSNTASDYYSTTSGGRNNTAGGQSSTVGGGASNTASGTKSTVGGGTANTASSSYSTVPGGIQAVASKYGELAHAAGAFNSAGDAQHSIFVLRTKTTNNTATEMGLDGSSTRLTVDSGQILSGTINIVGSRSDGSAIARYLRQFTIKNVGGTTSLVGSIITLGTDDAASTSISITADNTNDFLSIKVTGISSQTWRWVAVVDCIKTNYGT